MKNISAENAINSKAVNSKLKTDEKENENKADLTLLNEIHKTAELGKLSLETIINKIKDVPFKNVLLSEYQSYDAMTSKISVAITELNKTPKSSATAKASAMKTTIKIKLAFNDSPAHIADMLIKGNNMGIITINKRLNELKDDCTNKSTELAKDLLELEQKQIDELKVYL